MKKRLAIYIVAVAALLAVAFVCALPSRGTLTLTVELPPESADAMVVTEPAEIVSAEITGRVVLPSGDQDYPDTEKIVLTLNALKPGKTSVVVVFDYVDPEGFYSKEVKMPVTVLRGGVIFDGLTYNFSGWKQVSVAAALVIFTLGVLMIFDYRARKKTIGFFSYKSVAILGMGLFLAVSGCIYLYDSVNVMLSRDGGTVWLVLVKISLVYMRFLTATSPVILLCAAALCASNIVLIRHEGFSPLNMLGIAAGGIMAGADIFGINLSRGVWYFSGINEFSNVFAGMYVYFICQMAAIVICGTEAAVSEPEYDTEYVLILGCRIRPDGTLYPLIRSRVDRALEFIRAQAEKTGNSAVLVPSGGKGSDEKLAEADAMALYLRQQGVPEESILVENRSATTRENMLFSRCLIEKNCDGLCAEKTTKVAFSTSGYHVFRSGILAAEQGWKISGMGAPTKWYYWPNAFLRELAGLFVDSIGFQLLILLCIAGTGIGLAQIL